MKKLIALFVLAGFLSMSAIGCGESTPSKPATTPPKAEKKEDKK